MGIGPFEALRGSYFSSLPFAFTITADGAAAAMFGVGPHPNSPNGCPWLLGTDAIRTIRRQFFRESKLWAGWMARFYPTLHNVVDVENVDSIDWLKHCGFTVSTEAVFLRGNPFYPFWR